MRHIAVQFKDIAGLQMPRLAFHGQPHLASGEDGVHGKRVGVGVEHGVGWPVAFDHLVKASGGGLLLELVKARQVHAWIVED